MPISCTKFAREPVRDQLCPPPSWTEKRMLLPFSDSVLLNWFSSISWPTHRSAWQADPLQPPGSQHNAKLNVIHTRSKSILFGAENSDRYTQYILAKILDIKVAGNSKTELQITANVHLKKARVDRRAPAKGFRDSQAKIPFGRELWGES